MSTTVFLRCPCCGNTHRVSKSKGYTTQTVLDLQQRNIRKSEDSSFAWVQESAQGPDGRWRAGAGDPLDDNDPDARTFLGAIAERARAFLAWYDAPHA